MSRKRKKKNTHFVCHSTGFATVNDETNIFSSFTYLFFARFTIVSSLSQYVSICIWKMLSWTRKPRKLERNSLFFHSFFITCCYRAFRIRIRHCVLLPLPFSFFYAHKIWKCELFEFDESEMKKLKENRWN